MGRVEPEVLALRERLRTDTVFWSEHCARIISTEKRNIPLSARPWQLDFDAALEKQRLAGRPQRAIILKARKLGFSTWVQAKIMQRVTQNPYEVALVVAHRQDAAATLYDIGDVIYDGLPSDMQLAELVYGPGTTRGAPFTMKPPRPYIGTSRSGARWMNFGHKLRRSEWSLYQTMTAGAKGGARSATPSIIHASEVGQFEDPDFLVGLFNSLPMIPGTLGIQESTAQGFNHFYDAWQLAVESWQGGEGLWCPLFYGWQDNPFNALPFLNDRQRDRFERTIGDADGGGDDDEPWLVEEFGVTLEQLNWRRAVRDGPDCKYGSVEMFHQEHPATPEQAFIGSGTPVFAGILVARAIKQAEAAPEPVLGVLRGLDWKERPTRSGTVRIPQKALWVPEDQMGPEDADKWGLSHQMHVWEHPVNAETESEKPAAERKPDGQYVVFADIAVGSAAVEDGDWHAVQVLDHVTRMQVARYRSKVPVHDLPVLLYLVGLYYNVAWLAPEVNGPGQGVIDVLAADLRYPRLYRRHRRGDDLRQGVGGVLLGWMTTSASKWLMEQTFGEALSDGTHGLRDVLTGREFTTYVQDPDNPAKHGALAGANDDLAMAFMGAHRIADELRPRVEKKGHRRPRGFDSITGYGGF